VISTVVILGLSTQGACSTRGELQWFLTSGQQRQLIRSYTKDMTSASAGEAERQADRCGDTSDKCKKTAVYTVVNG